MVRNNISHISSHIHANIHTICIIVHYYIHTYICKHVHVRIYYNNPPIRIIPHTRSMWRPTRRRFQPICEPMTCRQHYIQYAENHMPAVSVCMYVQVLCGNTSNDISCIMPCHSRPRRIAIIYMVIRVRLYFLMESIFAVVQTHYVHIHKRMQRPQCNTHVHTYMESSVTECKNIQHK